MNVAYRLFHMVPGDDDRDPERGLNIAAKKFQTYGPDSRDVEYESEIKRQFMKYTDIIPKDINATFQNGLMVVLINVTYNGREFMVSLSSDPNKLSTMIQPTRRI